MHEHNIHIHGGVNMAFSKYIITSAGRNMLLSCMATGDFQIKSLVLGSGSYSGILSEISEVVEPQVTFEGENLVVTKRENQLEVRCRLTNDILETGFEWREYGVYATDGESTVLYCYDNAGEEPVPITAASTGAGISNTIKVIIAVDDAATVNVSFEPMPDITLDSAVTEDGENAVTGAAVYAFVQAAVPESVPADIITAGTLAGQVQANGEAAAVLSVAQVRNIICGTADVAEMLEGLNPGDIYFTVAASEEEEAT